MKSSSEFLKAGLYLGYVNYHATGEGVTSCISVAGSARRAEQIIRERLPDYFHVGIVTGPISEGTSEDIARMIEWVPANARSTLVSIPGGTGEYYSEFHYNLS